MYKELFKRIIDASQNKSLTFFVGAGVSKLSNAPKWSELIDAFSDSLGRSRKNPYSSEEYLSIPQMFYYSIGQDDNQYYSFINNCFGDKQLTPNLIHKMLLDFNPHAFITTNFDDLLETAATENCQSFKSIACDEDVSQINGDRFILKLHGDLKHQNIVLKEEDYLNYSENFKLVETFLKSIFATNTVVFIGYGLNDYNIKLILNWTKTLLKEKFNKPIFIYTDDAELTKDELTYHESKGLSVVEYQKCLASSDTSTGYLGRYQCVLNAINEASNISLEGKSETEAFEILYSLLAPLYKVKALRPRDVRTKLFNKVMVENYGEINASVGEPILFRYFMTINGMSDEDRDLLSKDVAEKYRTIVSVLTKAQIYVIIGSDRKRQRISCEDTVFSDPLCLTFDYAAIEEYVRNKYADCYHNYKKAFYLAKLNRYKESYELFVNVASEAYSTNDYLLYFMAQANRYVLFQAMESANRNLTFYNNFDLGSLKGGTISLEQIEQVFENLPIAFQNEYRCFKDIASFDMLYENSYYSFQDGLKLQDALETNSVEFGVTSTDKVISRINTNLHFFLGNCLYMEEFTEFKTTIRNLMSILVYKYAMQSKKSTYRGFFGEKTDEIHFDYLDFYCFVECFDCKQLNRLLQKHSVDTLTFQNIETVETSAKNLLSYYAEVLKTNSRIEILSYQNKIKRCLNLLRHMDISQELVDYVCTFIFKYEFREICIGDKILFLDSQQWKKKKYSAVTANVIENKLIYYIDKRMNAIAKSQRFELFSSHSNLNYPNLVHYISADENFTSRKLAYSITKIIKNSISHFKN